MKTKYLLMFVVLLGISSFTFAQLSTAIPDAVFEQELVDQLIDSDGLVNGTVLTADISGVISLDVSNAANASGIGIDDLTGITAFVALQTLNCSDNDLTALDVTGLGALTTLNCSDNAIIAANFTLPNPSVLSDLNCSDNSLGTLDVSPLTTLVTLNASNNSLTSLNCSGNIISTLTIAGNTGLLTLDCSTNKLTGLDVSAFTSLTSFDISNQTNAIDLTTLDLTGLGALTTLNCSDNAIVTANFTLPSGTVLSDINSSSNKLISLDVSSYTNLTSLNISNQTNATDLTSLVLTTNTLLEDLDCSSNSLTALVLTPNTALTDVDCSDNDIPSLDVSTATALETLVVSGNVNMTYLNCNGNLLQTLSVSTNTLLEELYCNNNSLTALGLTANTALNNLDCSGNSLTALNTANNVLLETLDCHDNNITVVDVHLNPALTAIDCSDNALVAFDIANGFNTNITGANFDARSNSSLLCIQVDNVTYANYNWPNKDAASGYSVTCAFPIPFSDWTAIYFALFLIVTFMVFRHRSRLFGTAFLVAFLFINVSLIGQNPFYVTLQNPNSAGVELVIGEAYTISWIDNLSQPVEIRLWNPNKVGGAGYEQLAPSVTGSTWAWDMDNTYTATTGYYIQIRSTTSPTTYHDEGLTFELVYAPDNSITVIRPAATGISWARGTTHLISWTDNINEPVAVQVSDENGANFATITGASSVTGSTFSWDIPSGQTVGTAYKIRVVSTDFSTLYADSENPFEITLTSGGFTEIYQPNDASVWAKSITHLISWNDNIPGTVDLYYENDGLGGEEEIAIGVVGSTYLWYIPLLITDDDYTVIIKSTQDPSIEITSGEFDLIQTAGGISAIYQPLDNTSWTVGTTHLISWLDNLDEPLDVYYSYNGGAEVLIEDNVVGTTVLWSIPTGLATGVDKYKIIIRSPIDPNVVYRESDLFDLTASSGSDIVVIQPNITGISWARGTGHLISWDNDFPENVTIDLLRYNAANVLQQTTNLVDNTSGAEGSTWVWDIDGSTTVSDYYKIQIASIDDPTNLVAESDEYFSITGSSGTFVTVQSPNGGEDWMYNTEHYISWTDNCPENMYIYLEEYNSGGTHLATHDIETVGTGTTVGVEGSMYTWLIDQTLLSYSNQFKIRVVSVSGQAGLVDYSDDFFDIYPFGKSPTSNFSLDDIESKVVMYPNPTNGHFVISSPIGISNVKVYDIFGKVLYSKIIGEEKEVNIDMTNYDAGVYFVKIVIKDMVVSKKLCIH